MIGSLWPAAVVGAQARAVAHGLETHVLDAGELRRRYPAHVIAGDDVAVLDSRRIYPARGCGGRDDRPIRRLGGEVRRGVVVKDCRSDNGVGSRRTRHATHSTL